MRPIILIFLIASLPVLAQKPDSTSALNSMLNAELGFAQSSVMHGRNAAFVENFAEESVVFTSKWITNGKQFCRERKESPVVLKWEPEFMDISRSRDFGISTGPWEMQDYRPNTESLSTGYFLTVWKKQTGGVWKVILDAGSETPPPVVNHHRISFPSGADKPVINAPDNSTSKVSAELLEREKQILGIWKNNPVPSTYASFLGADARIQMGGELPKIKRDSINTWLLKLNKSLSWTSVGSNVAASGDMGFTYGLFETHNVNSTSSGHYVRIWKKQSDGRWLITLEMMDTDRFSTGGGG
jgi:ketosteroid isomerase-like protein